MVLINKGESNRKLLKMYAGKNFTHWFKQKKSWCGALKIDAWAAVNKKISLLWLYIPRVKGIDKDVESFSNGLKSNLLYDHS